MPSTEDILAVILGGGRGSRLYPLTKVRSKPAVPIAGKYRLIDIPISNCINSHIHRVAVLTQFNSVSLHRHISSTYNFDAFHSGWVQVWAAEQTMDTADWYQGTADAARKQLFQILSTRASHVLVLAGDHLYRMDYAAMARFHFDNNADITVAVQPVDKREVSRYGILKRKPDCRITDFAEKPKDPAKLADLVSRDDPDRPYLGSMGIYLFKTETLLEMLEDRSVTDFGSDLIPAAIQRKSVYGYDFNGYWEDIGTIRSFYETNLALAMPNSPFNFFDQQAPIYTHARFLPPSVVQNTMMENVFMAEGCCIKNAEVRHSVIGLRSQIRAGAKIIDSFMMGSDYYDSPCAPDLENDARPNLGIGSNCHIEGAIIDKNAAIGRGTVIKPFPRGTDLDGDNWVVRDGIVVVVKNAVLPAGTYIGPEGGK